MTLMDRGIVMDWTRKQRRAASIADKQRRRQRQVDRSESPDIYSLTPSPDEVIVSHHAVQQFCDRVIPEVPVLGEGDSEVRCAKLVLQRVVSEGRRSDRDSSLRLELHEWVRFCTWNHHGRPVTLFFEESTRIGAMVVACHDFIGKVMVLTCFVAKEGA